MPPTSRGSGGSHVRPSIRSSFASGVSRSNFSYLFPAELSVELLKSRSEIDRSFGQPHLSLTGGNDVSRRRDVTRDNSRRWRAVDVNLARRLRLCDTSVFMSSTYVFVRFYITNSFSLFFLFLFVCLSLSLSFWKLLVLQKFIVTSVFSLLFIVAHVFVH